MHPFKSLPYAGTRGDGRGLLCISSGQASKPTLLIQGDPKRKTLGLPASTLKA